MIAPARIAVYDTLMAVSSGRRDLSSALADARASLPDERDRALAGEIATGVERWRAALDFIIAGLSSRPLDRLDPEILEILRMSLYQLTHLTRVPAAAVVDDAVELSRRAGKKSASGLVNAVLRNAARGRSVPSLPVRPLDASDRAAAIAYLSVTLSHPRWLVERWFDRYGFEATETWLTFNNRPAPIVLRANPLRTTRDALQQRLAARGVRTTVGTYGPDTLIVEEGRPDGDDFLVQDEASQLVALLTGLVPGPRVLDACAAPGGKTTAIAAAMSARGPEEHPLLVACDVRPRRMDLLARTCRSAGAPVSLVQASLLEPLPFASAFDCVMVDAPCTGLGTLRTDPDIRWRRTAADVAQSGAVALRMLANAAEGVAPGGRLVYATCSTEPEENEDVARAFLDAHSTFLALDATRAHPALPPRVVDARGHLRTSPCEHGLQAFFGAVFTRAPRKL